MGIWYPEPGNKYRKNYTPDDGPEHFYIEGRANWKEIKESADAKWGENGYSDLEITPEYIHTHALGYDLYDASDYTNYLLIERIKNA